MMASHSQFATLGENTSIANQVVAFIEQQTQTPYPQCLSALSKDLIAKARNIYIEELKKAQPIRPFIINKLPSNYQSIGLIYLLFPNAKFINLSRDFNATAFSVFSNYFAENEPYFCDLKEFKLYHALYAKLMDHWRSLPSLPLYDIHYEQIVAEPESQLSALFSFLGCEYEPQCLAFYKRKAAVSTLSKQAIRQPINTQALAHWERYKTPLLKQFE
ncbi:sulfotransferase [Pseudoalteromonas sp. Hal099]